MADADRLTIVSHDRFQEIVDHANDPDSIIRTSVVIGRDIPDMPTQAVTIAPAIELILNIAPQPAATEAAPVQQPLFTTETQRKVAETTLQEIRHDFDGANHSANLSDPAVQQKLAAKVMEEIRPVQGN